MSEHDYTGGRSSAEDELIDLVEAMFKNAGAKSPGQKAIIEAVEKQMKSDEAGLECISDEEWADAEDDWDGDREAWEEHHIDVYWAMESQEGGINYTAERIFKALTEKKVKEHKPPKGRKPPATDHVKEALKLIPALNATTDEEMVDGFQKRLLCLGCRKQDYERHLPTVRETVGNLKKMVEAMDTDNFGLFRSITDWGNEALKKAFDPPKLGGFGTGIEMPQSKRSRVCPRGNPTETAEWQMTSWPGEMVELFATAWAEGLRWYAGVCPRCGKAFVRGNARQRWCSDSCRGNQNR